MPKQGLCPLWGTPAQLEDPTGSKTTCTSPRAGGRFSITSTAEAMAKNLTLRERTIITFWMVKQRSLGAEQPSLDSDKLSAIRLYPKPSISERAEYLLRYIEQRSELLGQVLKFYAQDNTKNPDNHIEDEILAWTCSLVLLEVITLIEFCVEEGWVEHKVTERAGGTGNNVHEFMLKPKGYAKLADLRGTNSASHQGFVAMWFSQSLDDAFNNGIEPAIRAAGYLPLRIDKKDHIGKIDDEIIAEIRRSRFVVSDFTCPKGVPRGNVYYEAGFAQGLNIPVFWTVRADSVDDLLFDTRQYNHIVWNDLEDLKKQLQRRIEAVIGDGPLKQK